MNRPHETHHRSQEKPRCVAAGVADARGLLDKLGRGPDRTKLYSRSSWRFFPSLFMWLLRQHGCLRSCFGFPLKPQGGRVEIIWIRGYTHRFRFSLPTATLISYCIPRFDGRQPRLPCSQPRGFIIPIYTAPHVHESKPFLLNSMPSSVRFSPLLSAAF